MTVRLRRSAGAAALIGALVLGLAAPAVALAPTLPPAAPYALTAQVSPDGSVHLRWSSAPGDRLAGYEVRLAPVGDRLGSAVTIGRAATTRWTTGPLAPGAWQLAVVAVADDGERSATSRAVRADVVAPPRHGNLLTRDQSTIEGDSAGFETSTAGVTFARSLAAASEGASSLVVAVRVAGRQGVMTARTWTPVTPGAAYSAAVDVRSAAPSALRRTVSVRIRWWATTGRELRPSAPVRAVLPRSRFLQVRVAGRAAPPGAVRASVELVLDTALAGDRLHADRWGLWEQAGAPAWSPGAAREGTVAAILGDSYAAGSGAEVPSARWAALAWAQKGWRLVDLARGGSGYVADGGRTAACGWVGCATLVGSTRAAVAARPAVVVVTGGRNDLRAVAVDPARVHAAVLATYARLRAALPAARIIAVTPLWDSSEPPAALATLAEWVREAARAQGAELVEGGSDWLTGRPGLTAADGIHPSTAGHREIAWRLLLAGL